MGQKLRYVRPCTHYLPPTPGLHSPTLLPFLQNFTDYLMLAQPWKFEVNCCSSGLTHPAACTRARVPPTYGHVQRTPFSPGLLKKVAVDWDQAKDSNDIFKFRRSYPVNFWRGGPKNSGPPRTPPLRLDPYIYQSIALDARIPNI